MMAQGESPAGEEPPSGWRSELPRVLGAWSAASILIGSIIGSGVFIKPKTVAAALPSPGWILACWIAAGVLALIGSLIFAELGSVYPGAGGQYTYLRESFGKLTAFLFGWTNLLIINSASIAALAVISAQYFFNLLPEGSRPAADSHWVSTASVIFIVLLTAANSIGVRWGAAIQNILTITKLAAIALVISGIFHPEKTSWSNLSPFWNIRGASPDADILAGFKGAFIAIFWAYDGWYLLSFSGGEIKNPRRNIPLGFILGILVVIAVYAAANLSYLLVMDLGEMKDVERLGGVAAEVTSRLYGEVGLLLFSVGIIGSTLGAANGNFLTGPRLSYAMARDGLFFRAFGRIHPRFLTPLSAIVLQGVIGVVYVYCGTFDQLTDSVVFAAWTFYLLTVLGYFILRRRHRRLPGVFLAPGFPVLPVVFVLFAGWFIAYSFMDRASLALRYLRGDTGATDGIYAILSAALIVLGIPVYYALRGIRSKDDDGRGGPGGL
ncbi:MAG TPA: amino acid permease [Planctomycetota bacterium]|nr:amino acid permease [Planctomycetota bacterium]